MILARMIRKGGLETLATAIPAIAATKAPLLTATVAGVANIAVAPRKGERTVTSEIVCANDDSITALRWLLHFTDRESLTVSFMSALNQASALAYYPDAVAAEPQADSPRRDPTDAEAREITGLVRAIFADETDVDQKAILAWALADPDGALRCYRAMAKDCGIVLPEIEDDRRRCTHCLQLRGRVCTIARPGGLVSASENYTPRRDTPHRCPGYQPKANDPDQRSGEKRWPGLLAKGDAPPGFWH